MTSGVRQLSPVYATRTGAWRPWWRQWWRHGRCSLETTGDEVCLLCRQEPERKSCTWQHQRTRDL